MTRRKNKCNNCEFCKRVYFEGYYRYYYFREIYNCAMLNKIIDVNSNCEQRRKRNIRYDFSAERFDGVIKDLETLAEFFGDK